MGTIFERKNVVFIKALRWSKIFGVSSFAKIDLTGISTGKNLTKIYRSFGPPKLLQNLPKFSRKCLPKAKDTGNFDHLFLVSEVDFPKNPPDFENLNGTQCLSQNHEYIDLYSEGLL